MVSQKDYKRENDNKIYEHEQDYESCDFTLLNCFAVKMIRNEGKKCAEGRTKKYNNGITTTEIPSKLGEVAICNSKSDLIVNNYKTGCAQTQYYYEQNPLFLYLFGLVFM